MMNKFIVFSKISTISNKTFIKIDIPLQKNKYIIFTVSKQEISTIKKTTRAFLGYQNELKLSTLTKGI